MIEKNIIFRTALDTTQVKQGTEQAKQSMVSLQQVGRELESTLERTFGIPVRQIKQYTAGLRGVTTSTNTATKATGVFSVALRTLRAALIATGIGAIVVLLGSFVAWLTTSEKGVNALAKATGFIQGVFGAFVRTLSDLFQSLVDGFRKITDFRSALSALGDLIVSQVTNRVNALIDILGGLGRILTSLINFEFKEAGRQAREIGSSFVQLATGVEDAGKKIKLFGADLLAAGNQGAKVAQMQRELEAAIVASDAAQERLNATIQDGLAVARDNTLSIEERQKALKQAQQATAELAKEERSILEQRIALQKEEVEATEEGSEKRREALFELQRIESERDKLDATARNRDRSLLRFRDMIIAQENKQQEERANARQDILNQIRDIEQEAEVQAIRDSEQRALRLLEIEKERQVEEINQIEGFAEEKAQLLEALERRYERIATEIRAEAAAERLKSESELEFEVGKLRLNELEKSGKEYTEAMIALLETRRDEIIAQEELTGLEREKIELEFQQRIDGIRQDYADREKQRQEDLVNSIRQTQEQMVDGVFQLSQNLNTIIEQRNEHLTEQDRKRLENEEITQEEFERRKIQRERSAAIRSRAVASFQALVNTFREASENLSNPALFALTIAMGLANVASINAAPLPSFKDGVIDFRGKGTTTSDENTVNISNRESVMTAKETAEFKPYLEGMRKGTFYDMIRLDRATQAKEDRRSSKRNRVSTRRKQKDTGTYIKNYDMVGWSVAKHLSGKGYTKQ